MSPTFKAPFIAVALLALACTPPPTLEEVADKTGKSLSGLTGEAWDSVAASTNGSTGLADFVTALNLTLVDLGQKPWSKPNVQTRASMQATFDTYEKFLKEKVFIKANIESQGADGFVFLLHGKDLCGSAVTPSTPTTPSNAAAIAQCEKGIDDQQIRVAVSGDPDKRLTLDIAMGPNRYSPFSFVIEKDRSIEVTMRLDQYQNVLNEIVANQRTTATPLPYTNQLGTLEGEYRFRAERLGNLDFAFSLDVTRDVKMGFRGADGQLRTYQLAARTPMYRVRFDGVNHTQELNFDVGAISWVLPVSDVTGAKETKPFAVTLQGMKFDLTTGSAPLLAKGKLSLLPSRVTYDGLEVLDIPRGQSVDFDVSTAPDGRLKLTSTDADMSARFHFSSVPGWKGDLAALGDENWRMKLTGPRAAVKLSSIGAATPKDARLALKLLTGAFSLEALNAGQSLNLTAGMCGVKRDLPVGTGPLASFTTATCQ